MSTSYSNEEWASSSNRSLMVQEIQRNLIMYQCDKQYSPAEMEAHCFSKSTDKASYCFNISKILTFIQKKSSDSQSQNTQQFEPQPIRQTSQIGSNQQYNMMPNQSENIRYNPQMQTNTNMIMNSSNLQSQQQIQHQQMTNSMMMQQQQQQNTQYSMQSQQQQQISANAMSNNSNRFIMNNSTTNQQQQQSYFHPNMHQSQQFQNLQKNMLNANNINNNIQMHPQSTMMNQKSPMPSQRLPSHQQHLQNFGVKNNPNLQYQMQNHQPSDSSANYSMQSPSYNLQQQIHQQQKLVNPMMAFDKPQQQQQPHMNNQANTNNIGFLHKPQVTNVMRNTGIAQNSQSSSINFNNTGASNASNKNQMMANSHPQQQYNSFYLQTHQNVPGVTNEMFSGSTTKANKRLEQYTQQNMQQQQQSNYGMQFNQQQQNFGSTNRQNMHANQMMIKGQNFEQKYPQIQHHQIAGIPSKQMPGSPLKPQMLINHSPQNIPDNMLQKASEHHKAIESSINVQTDAEHIPIAKPKSNPTSMNVSPDTQTASINTIPPKSEKSPNLSTIVTSPIVKLPSGSKAESQPKKKMMNQENYVAECTRLHYLLGPLRIMIAKSETQKEPDISYNNLKQIYNALMNPHNNFIPIQALQNFEKTMKKLQQQYPKLFDSTTSSANKIPTQENPKKITNTKIDLEESMLNFLKSYKSNICDKQLIGQGNVINSPSVGYSRLSHDTKQNFLPDNPSTAQNDSESENNLHPHPNTKSPEKPSVRRSLDTILSLVTTEINNLPEYVEVQMEMNRGKSPEEYMLDINLILHNSFWDMNKENSSLIHSIKLRLPKDYPNEEINWELTDQNIGNHDDDCLNKAELIKREMSDKSTFRTISSLVDAWQKLSMVV